MQPTVRGAQAGEIGKVLDFCGELFGASREYFAARFDTCPPAKPEDSRVVVIDDRVVSHIRVYRRDMRLRGSVVPSGHIAEVMTHPEFRRQGHGGAILRDCVQYIRSLGYPLSCVWSGVTEFYCSEHWVRFPLIATSLQVDRWFLEAPGDVGVRRYVRGTDDRAVAEIYEEYNRGRNLSVVRDSEYWRLHHSWIRGESEDGFLIAEKNEAPVGYCRAGGADLIELGLRDGCREAAVALVASLVKRARKSKAGNIRMTLPADEDLITRAPRLRYRRELVESMLMRVIDLKAILDVALRSAGARLREIGFKGSHAIAIEVLGQKCAIALQDGAATAQALPESAAATPLAQKEFFKLIFGAQMEKDLTGFSRDDRHLLNDLFPPDGPVYWRVDVL